MAYFSKIEELCLTYAMLMGVEFAYDDYGHPERAGARQYWRARHDGIEACGYTQAGAAQHLFRIKGIKVTLTSGLLENQNV